MSAQASVIEGHRGAAGWMALIGWFIPAELLHSRTNRGLARVFVTTHLLGAVAALAMSIHLASVVHPWDAGIYALAITAFVLGALPFVLRQTGHLAFATFISFQVMAMAALIGTYQYGGFASPFLPWLMVSLMTGLFYQSRRVGLVIGLFVANVMVFFAIVLWQGQPAVISSGDLRTLSWVSIAVAMTYMAFMALYYARVTASRAELRLEAERYQQASIELEQARRVAEEVNRQRSLFFAKMSHELRTPLNAIIGYSEILLEECEDDPGTNTQRMADLNRINSTGKHLLSLVSEVLDTETVENGRITVEAREFSLGELCDAVCATAQPLVEKNGNRLVVDCPLRQDRVKTDDKKLRQMLINLLSNAAKFTSQGMVTLELWIERDRADNRLHAAVRDTGIGIAAEVLPQLFETYMQADATIQQRFGGTGIGLALTRKFAVLMGGTITATSRPGEGSTFLIDIPAELRLGPNDNDSAAATDGDSRTASRPAA